MRQSYNTYKTQSHFFKLLTVGYINRFIFHIRLLVPIIPIFLPQIHHQDAIGEHVPMEAITTLKPWLSDVRIRYPGGPPVSLPSDQNLVIMEPKLARALGMKKQTTKREPNGTLLRIPSSQKVKQVIQDIFESSVMGNVIQPEPPPEKVPAKLIHENGIVGALFASKAFVQLVVNPLVGYATVKHGYAVPFLFGTVVLFTSSLSECGTAAAAAV